MPADDTAAARDHNRSGEQSKGIEGEVLIREKVDGALFGELDGILLTNWKSPYASERKGFMRSP